HTHTHTHTQTQTQTQTQTKKQSTCRIRFPIYTNLPRNSKPDPTSLWRKRENHFILHERFLLGLSRRSSHTLSHPHTFTQTPTHTLCPLLPSTFRSCSTPEPLFTKNC